LSQRVRTIDADARKQAELLRIQALENDNYDPTYAKGQDSKYDDDDEYVDIDDDDDDAMVIPMKSKKKGSLGGGGKRTRGNRDGSGTKKLKLTVKPLLDVIELEGYLEMKVKKRKEPAKKKGAGQTTTSGRRGGNDDGEERKADDKGGREAAREEQQEAPREEEEEEEEEEDEEEEEERPNYVSIAAPAPACPPRRFCTVCGHWGVYSCSRCLMRTCSMRCMETHKETRCLKFGLS